MAIAFFFLQIYCSAFIVTYEQMMMGRIEKAKKSARKICIYFMTLIFKAIF